MPANVATDAILQAVAPLPGVTLDRSQPPLLRIALNGELLATVDSHTETVELPVPRDLLNELLRVYPSASGERGVLTMPLTESTAAEAARLVLHQLRVNHFRFQYESAGP